MTYSELILSHSPSNYWRLNEASGLTAADSAGSAPGTISGGVTLGAAGALADGTTAMAFNGTTGKIDTGASVSLPLVVSIECWMKTTDGSAQRAAVSDYSAGTGNTIFCGIAVGGGLFCYSTAGFGGFTVHDGLWHHIVYLLDGATVTFYKDGVNTGSGAMVRTLPASGVLSIGADVGLSQYWNGSIDEVAIYPRALTPTEISDHYAARTFTGGTDRQDLNTEIAVFLGYPVPTADLTTLVSTYLKAHATGDALKDYKALIAAATR